MREEQKKLKSTVLVAVIDLQDILRKKKNYDVEN